MKQDAVDVLIDNLGGAHAEFERAVSWMCERMNNGTELSQEELLHFIGNETAKCLADYKTAIIQAFAVL